MKEQLRSFVKRSPLLLRIARKFDNGNLFKNSYSKSIKGKNNTLKIHRSAALINCKIDVVGNANRITIEEGSLLNNVIIFVRGSENQITISKEVKFNRAGELWIEDENCELFIGKNSSFEDTHIAVTEKNSKITFGSDCMFANGIDIRTGDSHSIIDAQNNKRINHAKNVTIADHVWVGAHASILKGSSLGTNSIVATRSVVTKSFDIDGVLIAGIPAKIIKHNITWLRERIT